MKNFRFLLYICMAGMAIPSGAQDGAMRMAGKCGGLGKPEGGEVRE